MNKETSFQKFFLPTQEKRRSTRTKNVTRILGPETTWQAVPKGTCEFDPTNDSRSERSQLEEEEGRRRRSFFLFFCATNSCSLKKNSVFFEEMNKKIFFSDWVIFHWIFFFFLLPFVCFVFRRRKKIDCT